MKFEKLIYGLFIVLVGALVFITITDSPRDELLERYASVEEINWSPKPWKCYSTKKRYTYYYSATTHNGVKVTGYICHTPGPFAIIDSKIHEDEVDSSQ